jgi:hypothetical protein
MPGAGMDKRIAVTLLLLSLGSCSRHEHLTPLNYSPPLSVEPEDVAVRTTLVQQSIKNYQGPCPCPYSGPSCPGHSAYDNPQSGQSVYCYTKDVPADMVSTYRVTLASRPSNDEAGGAPLPITAPHP